MNFQYQLQQVNQSIMTMLNQLDPIVKTYQPLIIGAGIALLFMLTLKLIRSRRRQLQHNLATTYSPDTNDMKMLAGEDVVSTQFDLAHAYIEMGKAHLAKSILFHISKSGNSEQKKEANRLIATL